MKATMNFPKQMPGEKFADFKERERLFNLERNGARARLNPPKVKRAKARTKSAWERNADIVDGFNRDDLGLSDD